MNRLILTFKHASYQLRLLVDQLCNLEGKSNLAAV